MRTTCGSRAICKAVAHRIRRARSWKRGNVSTPQPKKLRRNRAHEAKRKKETHGKIVESFELYGKQYRFETGELAKQATGAVLVTQGDTTILVTAVVSKQEKDYDFFPLTVDYIEKMYSVGRIPGGYLKREARPSERAP